MLRVFLEIRLFLVVGELEVVAQNIVLVVASVPWTFSVEHITSSFVQVFTSDKPARMECTIFTRLYIDV